jgi:hypothetical protein
MNVILGEINVILVSVACHLTPTLPIHLTLVLECVTRVILRLRRGRNECERYRERWPNAEVKSTRPSRDLGACSV